MFFFHSSKIEGPNKQPLSSEKTNVVFFMCKHSNMFVMVLSVTWLRVFKHVIQGISQGGKKFCILHELANKTQLGVWTHCQPLNGFSGRPGTKAV